MGQETICIFKTLISEPVILTLEILPYFKINMIPRDPVYKDLLRFGFIKLQSFEKKSKLCLRQKSTHRLYHAKHENITSVMSNR